MEKQHSQQNIRPPIVTVMGHVDHGKTTLLDAIRKTNVVAREHGGITQHIGAYQINFQDKLITFIDTPGHEVFEKMRSRGADVADIVVLVVAANDSVKPQTVEAIKHIQKSQKPTIVAITKIDLPDINIERVKKELQSKGIAAENYGGDVPVVEVASPKGKGISELLEVILLVWQLSSEDSLPEDPLEAVVIESFLDKNRGPIATVIVKKGTLSVGQKIAVDNETINVRALIDDTGKNVQEALPGKPVEILGFKKILDVGSIIGDTVKTAIIQDKKPLDIADIIAKGEQTRENFKAIIKADVNGSLEAILSNLPENILVVASGVGGVTEKELTFAKIAKAPILAFNLKIPKNIKSQAEREGVFIREYNVIYQLLSDLEDVVAHFKKAKYEQKIVGRAKIIAIFNMAGQMIAGTKVLNGKIKIGDNVAFNRQEGSISKEAKITSLKKFKKDVETVFSGQDCGVGFTPSLDFKVGDIIESFGQK